MRFRLSMLVALLSACQASAPSQDSSSSDETAKGSSAISASEQLTWHALSSATPAPPTIAIAGDEVTMQLAGYYTASQIIDGRSFTRVVVPGSSLLGENGMPELPLVRANIRISDDAEPAVEVLDSSYTDVAIDAPVPSRGIITRDQDPADVPYVLNGFYTSRGQFPASIVELGAAFDARELHGVPVQFQPFTYSAQGSLRVYSSIRVRVAGAGDKSLRTVSSQFSALYASAFSTLKDQAEGLSEISEAGRMVIISADAFVDAVAPLRDWKTRRGFKVQVKKVSEVGKDAAAIQAYIASEFNSADPISFVILVGDSDTIPTLKGGYEKADCDTCYAMVKGSDFYPDLLISRISAKTVAQVQTQVAKFVAYERTPDANGEWYTKAIGIASNQGDPTDFSRAEELRTALEGYGYTAVAKVYDPTATKAQLISAWSAGASIVNYIGHGGGTFWGTTNFGIADVPQLTNVGSVPFVLDVACQNGDFVNHDASLAEALLRAGTPTQAAGALADYAASTNAAWVPPTVMQKSAVTALVAETHMSLGALAFGGAMAVLEQYPDGDGQMLVEQYNLFGDASVTLRTKKPHALTVNHASSLQTSGALSVTVTLADGSPAAGVTVVLSGTDIYAAAHADATGTASLAFAGVAATGADLTVTGLNAVPYEAHLARQ